MRKVHEQQLNLFDLLSPVNQEVFTDIEYIKPRDYIPKLKLEHTTETISGCCARKDSGVKKHTHKYVYHHNSQLVHCLADFIEMAEDSDKWANREIFWTRTPDNYFVHAKEHIYYFLICEYDDCHCCETRTYEFDKTYIQLVMMEVYEFFGGYEKIGTDWRTWLKSKIEIKDDWIRQFIE